MMSNPPNQDDSAADDVNDADGTTSGHPDDSQEPLDPYAPPPYKGEEGPPLPPGILSRKPWLTFLLPFIIYMLVGSIEPDHPDIVAEKEKEAQAEAEGHHYQPMLPIDYDDYPVVYTIKVALTLAAMLFVMPGYRTFEFRLSWLAVLIGVVGGVIWVAIGYYELDSKLLEALGWHDVRRLGARPAFNPFEQIGHTAWAYLFLTIRFAGLVLIVPIMEEFFLRGFVMRLFVDSDWWFKVPFGQLTPIAIIIGTVVPMLSHPGEPFASLIWFSMVTWLMLRTRSIWDCILAHMITNLMIGIFVLATGFWALM